MRVTLTLPDHVWGKLASKADTEQVKVADIIADAIKAELTRHAVPPRPAVATRIDLTVLREMHARGCSDAQIAAQVGFHVTTVREQRIRLGLPLNGEPRPTRADKSKDAAITGLHAKGLNDRKIADELGIPFRFVARVRARLDLPANDHRGAVRKSKGTES
jgi:hypothetical protein